MLDFIRAYWQLMTVIGVGTIAVVGVIYGIIRYELYKGKDHGWIKRRGVELFWSRDSFPISVLIHPGLQKHVVQALVHSLHEYMAICGDIFLVGENDPVGFRWDRIPPKGCIAVTPVLPYGPTLGLDPTKAYGHTEHWYERETGEINAARITVPEIPVDRIKPLLIHEVGHVLGLAHDEEVDSVMYKKATMATQILTANDKRRLQDRYRKERS